MLEKPREEGNERVLVCVPQHFGVHGQRGRDGDAAAERAAGQGDEADGHSPGSPQLCPPAGPAP